MSEEKHKFVTNTHSLQDAVLFPRQARSKDLTDIQPIGYLSGLKAEDNTSYFTRDTILRLIATLKEK
jgi:hypothetical protein